MLAKNFGLNTNGECFLQVAKSVPFSIVRKESFDVENLEALFFGKLNLLNEHLEDEYHIKLASHWKYLKIKYNLESEFGLQPHFFKLRPDNFPTIRLSQLVGLICNNQNLFSQLIEVNSYSQIKQLLKSETSEYWKSHYNFSKTSKTKSKVLTNQFIDLIIINTIIPIKFCHAKNQGKLNVEELIALLESMPAEKNSILNKFSEFNITTKTAFQSQSLLELKNEYCNKNKCLNCAVGLQLLKN